MLETGGGWLGFERLVRFAGLVRVSSWGWRRIAHFPWFLGIRVRVSAVG